MCDLFFFNDTATTEIYTLSLHDALPISKRRALVTFLQVGFKIGERRACRVLGFSRSTIRYRSRAQEQNPLRIRLRSEEHTSELQSRQYLVCRLLPEKKNIDAYCDEDNSK